MSDNFKIKYVKYIALIIIVLCIAGIFIEMLWVYDKYYDVQHRCTPAMSIISISQCYKDTISAAIRLTILFAVLFAVNKNDSTHFNTVLIIIFRALRTVMLSMGAFEILFNVFVGYLFSYNLADRIITGGLAIGLYGLFLAMEGKLIIHRMQAAKGKVQRIFIIELLCIGLLLIYVGLVHIDFNSIYILEYIRLGYYSILGIIYTIGYITAIGLTIDKLRGKKDEAK